MTRVRRPSGVTAWLLGATCLAQAFGAVLVAQPGMPDIKQMSGIPRPVTDLPDGAISVRVVRGELTNNVANQTVELRAGSSVLTQKTDQTGHAQFSGLTAGATVRATTEVDGERLESQDFVAPDKGGIRLMLVATDSSKAAPSSAAVTPPVAGAVVLGVQSRIVVEPVEDAVQVFFLLDISNAARVPVTPATPFVFEMPNGAANTTLLEGSSPLASVDGTRVTVASPLPPGQTFVEVACELAATSGEVTVTQVFPAAMEQLTVLVKKVGGTTLSSPMLAGQRDMPSDRDMFIAASGGAVAAGKPITFTVAGFPHHSTVPSTVALALAVVIVCIGIWGAGTTGDDPSLKIAEHKRQVARREKLFGDLVKLENERRSGRGDPRRQEARRAELVAALEQVYGALDDVGAGLEAGSRGGPSTPLDRPAAV